MDCLFFGDNDFQQKWIQNIAVFFMKCFRLVWAATDAAAGEAFEARMAFVRV